MTDWAQTLKAIQKLPARYPFAVAVLGLIFLLMPNRIAAVFGILDTRATYRAWIGIVTIAAMVLGFVQLIPWFQQQRRQRSQLSTILGYINGLSFEESIILAECVRRRQQTIILDIASPYATSLCNKGLMRKASGHGELHRWPYIIPPAVWKHINSNRHQLVPEEMWNDVERAFLEITHDPLYDGY